MVTLGALATGHDNNLNLLRAVAATAVLVSHAYPIALGPGSAQPMAAATGYTLGSLSVFVFFAISGFLITASFERTRSHTSFLLARFLRLMPGLFVNLLLVAFLLGPLVTTLSWQTYFSIFAPYEFFLRNMALFPLVFELPGVFQDQPFPSVVGSIWSLRHEVLCYMGIFFAGLLGAWKRPQRAALWLGTFACVWLAVELIDPDLPGPLHSLHRLTVPFAMGTAFYVWRDRLPLSLWGVAGTAVLAWLAHDTPLYVPALSLALAYATFWLGYVPAGAIRGYNRVGDYSYGIYIYAFPLQGFVVWLFGPQTPLENMLYSFPPTLVLSILSWHLVEGPAMALKPRLQARIQTLQRRWSGASRL